MPVSQRHSPSLTSHLCKVLLSKHVGNIVSRGVVTTMLGYGTLAFSPRWRERELVVNLNNLARQACDIIVLPLNGACGNFGIVSRETGQRGRGAKKRRTLLMPFIAAAAAAAATFLRTCICIVSLCYWGHAYSLARLLARTPIHKRRVHV